MGFFKSHTTRSNWRFFPAQEIVIINGVSIIPSSIYYIPISIWHLYFVPCMQPIRVPTSCVSNYIHTSKIHLITKDFKSLRISSTNNLLYLYITKNWISRPRFLIASNASCIFMILISIIIIRYPITNPIVNCMYFVIFSSINS